MQAKHPKPILRIVRPGEHRAAGPMKLPQFLTFVALAFLSASVYFIAEALLGAAVGWILHSRPLGWVFDNLVPFAIGLVLAGWLGAWRASTHVAYQALSVFASGLILGPARFAVAALGITLCGVLKGGCFD